jgi:hypothetical protein
MIVPSTCLPFVIALTLLLPAANSAAAQGTARDQRKDRWVLEVKYKDTEDLRKRLVELQTVVMVPEGEGKFRLWRNPAKHVDKGEAVDIQGLVKLNRIWFTLKDQDDREAAAKLLGLAAVPDYVTIFIPQDLEQEMLNKELAYRGLTEAQLNAGNWETAFEVHRKNDKWDVRVVEQKKKQ